MARFLHKEYVPARQILPMLMPSRSFDNLNHTEHPASDLYIVEISSAREIKVGADCIQVNYINRHYWDFFSDRKLARQYWSLSSKNDRDGMAVLLERSPAFQSYDREDQDLLRNVEMSMTRREDLRRDILELIERLKNIAIVTHCNARQPDGSFWRSRSEFIALVKEVCSEIDVPCYDPTAQMECFGQEHAMQEQGLNTTHYTPEFETILYRSWKELWIAPLLATKVAQAGGGTVASTTLDQSDLPALPEAVSRETIRRALQVKPNNPELNRMLGNLLTREGALAEALACFAVIEAVGELEPADVLTIGQCHFERGQFDQAREYAEMYLAKDEEGEDGLLLAARSCEGAALSGKALAYWRELYQYDSHRAEACLNAANIESARGNHAEALVWMQRLVEVNPENADAQHAYTELLAAVDTDDMTLSEALLRLAGLNLSYALDSLKAINAKTRTRAVSLTLSRLLHLKPHHAELRDIVKGFAAEWVSKGEAAKTSGDEFAAAKWYLAVENLISDHRLAILALRKIQASWLKVVRTAFRDRQYETVVHKGGLILTLRPEMGEVASLVGRSHFALAQWEEALAVLSAAVNSGAATAQTWLFRARAALKVNRFATAFDSYDMVLRLAGVEDNRIRREAELNCQRIPHKTVRYALGLMRAGELDKAWELSTFVLAHHPGDQVAVKVRTGVLRSLERRLRAEHRAQEDEASHTARSLLDKDPDNATALKIYARILMKERCFEKALPMWQRLQQLDPSDPSFERQTTRCVEWQRVLSRRSVPKTSPGFPR